MSLPELVAGWLPVPAGPGFGVEVNRGSVEALQSAPPVAVSRRISTVIYLDGVQWHFGDERQRHEAYYFGDLVGFVPGIRLEVREDDGSAAFATLYARCQVAPVMQRA